jgi:hypothetical protein
LLLIGATPAMAQDAAPDPNAPPAPKSDSGKKVDSSPCPSGPKAISFDAAMPDNNDPNAVVSFKVGDDSDNPAVTISLKPGSEPGTWDVFVKVGDGDPVPAGVGVPANVTMSFKVTITKDGIGLRYGEQGEAGCDFEKTYGPLPANFNLNAKSITLTAAWDLPFNGGIGADLNGDGVSDVLQKVEADPAAEAFNAINNAADNPGADANIRDFIRNLFVSGV